VTVRQPVTETTFEEEVLHALKPPPAHARRELARRVNGGIEVTLYWNTDDNSTSVEIWQPATEETLLFTVAKEQALEAFHHPFAHLPITFDNLIPALDA
jgi:hypothetical protein